MSGWLNACYTLLDQPVVDGHADDPVLLDDAVTHARLLEDVAAVAGVLRAQGIGPGVPVAVDVASGRRAVTGLLAVARLGGVLGEGLVIDDDDVGELGWDEALRLGRTDPAPVTDLAADAPWAGERTVGDLVRDLDGLDVPAGSAALTAVLARTSLDA